MRYLVGTLPDDVVLLCLGYVPPGMPEDILHSSISSGSYLRLEWMCIIISEPIVIQFFNSPFRFDFCFDHAFFSYAIYTIIYIALNGKTSFHILFSFLFVDHAECIFSINLFSKILLRVLARYAAKTLKNQTGYKIIKQNMLGGPIFSVF